MYLIYFSVMSGQQKLYIYICVSISQYINISVGGVQQNQKISILHLV